MRRRDLAARIAKRTGQTSAAVLEVLGALIEAIGIDLRETGRFELRGLGTFTVRSYPSRRIHNPATGEIVPLPARKSITYKASRKIRVALKVVRRSRPKQPERAGAKKTKPARKPRKGEPATGR